MSGKNSPSWKGGTIETVHGYIDTRQRGIYVKEHVLIAERVLGKPLPAPAEVHHFNEIKSDNRNQNLVICEDRAYHQLLHVRQRVVQSGGDPDLYKICSRCKACKPKTEFHRSRGTRDGLAFVCKPCNRRPHLLNETKIDCDGHLGATEAGG